MIHHVSKECKLFKECPFNWDCLYEIALCGTAVWSLELCYATADMMKMGFIEMKGGIETKLHFGMIGTFCGSIMESGAWGSLVEMKK